MGGRGRHVEVSQPVDLLVLGWGKGGKTLAAHAAREGRKVALVERSADMVGGACINVACIPTKILVHESLQRSRDEQRGLDDDAEAAFEAAVTRRDTLTSAMRHKNFDLLDGLDSVLLVQGQATFTGEREVLVTGGEETLRLTAETVVINTGSRAAVPSIEGATIGGRIHDSTTVQHVEPRPARLVVVGGGYVGLELAGVFARFGTDVVVLDRGDRPLAREDEDVAEAVVDALAQDGVRIVSRADVTSLEESADAVHVTAEVAGEVATYDAEAVLLAVGRVPVTDGLGLEVAGIATDGAGWVVVDERLRTSAPGVLAVGDVNGGPQFTYVS
ncbi:MAG: FAD-dependent oxidoreductase, partial [Actinomycetales bacterium]|nr:FAD-dependent oxidoreductase [Actinomycetales bacterium]